MSVELAERAAVGDMTPAVVAWVTAGLRRHFSGDDLDKALGLDNASRLRERNRALRDAATILNSGDDTAWQIAGKLALAIKRFERLHTSRAGCSTITTASPLNVALRRAFDTKQRLPRTRRKLYDFLK